MGEDIAPRRSIDALTSLRLFAALYVFTFHFGAGFAEARGAPAFVVTFLQNGYLAVSFFFILSGFVLATAYAGRLRGPGDLRSYGVARFARIYPVYLLALLAALPSFAPHFRLDIALKAPLLLQGWDLPTSSSGFLWNTQAWTLSVELAFYLLFPVLLWLLERLPRSGVLLLIGMCCALLASLPLASYSFEMGLARFPLDWLASVPTPLLRLPEFVLGSCLGYLLRGVPRSIAADWGIAATGIAVALLLMASTGDVVVQLVPLLFAALIVTTALAAGPIERMLSHRFLVLGGASSYALYLLQGPVRSGVGSLVGEAMARFIALPILLLVSVGVYLLFEEPLRKALRTSQAKGSRVPGANVGM